MSMVTVHLVTNKLLPEEFEQLFRDHSTLVYRTAYRITRNAEDAEDVLQTIFVRLLGRQFPPDLQKNPGAYLYRAAVNLSLDTIENRKNHVAIWTGEQLEAGTSPVDSITDEVMHQRLHAAIAKLKPAAAEIVILRYMHNLSDAAIAKLLGKSRGVIAVSLYRSRARLKKLMKLSLGETR
jgi:RNA polymerase sigma-70 factor (ECF subfamily)